MIAHIYYSSDSPDEIRKGKIRNIDEINDLLQIIEENNNDRIIIEKGCQWIKDKSIDISIEIYNSKRE